VRKSRKRPDLGPEWVQKEAHDPHALVHYLNDQRMAGPPPFRRPKAGHTADPEGLEASALAARDEAWTRLRTVLERMPGWCARTWQVPMTGVWRAQASDNRQHIPKRDEHWLSADAWTEAEAVVRLMELVEARAVRTPESSNRRLNQTRRYDRVAGAGDLDRSVDPVE